MGSPNLVSGAILLQLPAVTTPHLQFPTLPTAPLTSDVGHRVQESQFYSQKIKFG